MLVPDVLVCSVGTEIFFESGGEADKEWAAELDQGWDRQGALDVAAGISQLAPQVRGTACGVYSSGFPVGQSVAKRCVQRRVGGTAELNSLRSFSHRLKFSCPSSETAVAGTFAPAL